MSCTSILVSGAASLGIFLGLLFAVFFLVLTAVRKIRDFSSSDSERDGNCEKEKSGTISSDTVQVREFIEKLVEKLIGGPLDGITVGKLSKDSSYLAIFEKYHGLLCGELAKLGFTLHLSTLRNDVSQRETSDSVTLSLSRLIERIICEAVSSPNIKQIIYRSKANEKKNKDITEDENGEEQGFNDKTYEDILATAILNKVIENIQSSNEEKDDFKNIKETDKNDKKSIKGEIFVSHDEDWKESAPQPYSLTIEEHIEEVTTTFETLEDDYDDDGDDFDALSFRNQKIPFPESGKLVVNVVDDVADRNTDDDDNESSATELISSTNSWEENWLFQKKRPRSTPNAHHPVPVPMLVPNPSQDFKALVGGVDADDLSDSDAIDDLLEETPRLVTEINVRPGKIEVMVDEVLKEEKMKETEEVTGSKANLELAKELENSVAESLDIKPEINDKNQEEKESETVTHILPSPFRYLPPQRNVEEPVIPINMIYPYRQENINGRKKEEKMEYPKIGNHLKESEDFTDQKSSRNEFHIGKNVDSRITRDYYVNDDFENNRHAGASNIFQSEIDRDELEQEEHKVKENKEKNKKKERVKFDMEEIPEKPGVQSEFKLPNVREIAKNFSHSDREMNEDTQKNKLGGFGLDKEPELDYSSVPVAEIILNLTNILQSQENDGRYRKESFNGKTDNETKKEKPRNKLEKTYSGKFNGKEVHSLTARSISKEFREGLKNGSQVRGVKKGGKGADQDVVVSHKSSLSPSPTVDLKIMKKFWEELITANSVPQK